MYSITTHTHTEIVTSTLTFQPSLPPPPPQALRESFNNFNSYLAILSAIESSPISRLDWPDRVIKSLEEPRALIDNKGSFKNYREAFARAKPPCIPYM